ncbi:MAG: DUF2934 domain-containing protein [Candidatus Omnitrophica bacterium]|nr:DUF2934 domain-containing protein [Candidatus Omnitrophota bacterium]
MDRRYTTPSQISGGKTSQAREEFIRQKIQERAYFISRERGAGEGSSEEDWLKAEREILSELGRGPQVPPRRQRRKRKTVSASRNTRSGKRGARSAAGSRGRKKSVSKKPSRKSGRVRKGK